MVVLQKQSCNILFNCMLENVLQTMFLNVFETLKRSWPTLTSNNIFKERFLSINSCWKDKRTQSKEEKRFSIWLDELVWYGSSSSRTLRLHVGGVVCSSHVKQVYQVPRAGFTHEQSRPAGRIDLQRSPANYGALSWFRCGSVLIPVQAGFGRVPFWPCLFVW